MRSRISLSRRNFSEGGCSIRITEDVRKYAADQGLSEEEAVKTGLNEKAKEFIKKGSEVYAKT